MVDCQTASCPETLNSSRVFRGTHPHIVWTSDKLQDEREYIQTFNAIPLTSQTTFAGLPTTYPINKTSRNGLANKSYALVHQICTVDGNCFKTPSGDWMERMGQLAKKDKIEITRRLRYALELPEAPTDDWFKQNASPELVKKIYGYLAESEQRALLDDFLDKI